MLSYDQFQCHLLKNIGKKYKKKMMIEGGSKSQGLFFINYYKSAAFTTSNYRYTI